MTPDAAKQVVGDYLDYLLSISGHGKRSLPQFILMLEHFMVECRTRYATECCDADAIQELVKIAAVALWCVKEHGTSKEKA